jgi:hypothetical protein
LAAVREIISDEGGIEKNILLSDVREQSAERGMLTSEGSSNRSEIEIVLGVKI